MTGYKRTAMKEAQHALDVPGRGNVISQGPRKALRQMES